jgi:hypothetical protein
MGEQEGVQQRVLAINLNTVLIRRSTEKTTSTTHFMLNLSNTVQIKYN